MGLEIWRDIDLGWVHGVLEALDEVDYQAKLTKFPPLEDKISKIFLAPEVKPPRVRPLYEKSRSKKQNTKSRHQAIQNHWNRKDIAS